MNRTLYVEIENTKVPGCKVTMGLNGDCSTAHRDDALKFAAAITGVLGWQMEDVRTETTYTESDLEDKE